MDLGAVEVALLWLCLVGLQKAEVFPELVKVLSLLCKNSDSTDVVSFRAAVCLGKLCVQDKNAQEKLSQVLEQTHDTHIRAEVRLSHISGPR